MLFDQLPSEWGAQLHVPDEVLVAIDSSLQRERSQNVCYPPAGIELQALELVSPDAVKVVICGQDPYHGPGQAHGLAFSVAPVWRILLRCGTSSKRPLRTRGAVAF